MHNRRARWLVPFLTASLLVSASAASTAFAKNGRGGGKKPRGEVTSFDTTSMALVVAMRNGDTFEGSVDPDAQVKVEHRGNHSHGQGHGNPSRGSLEDIVPGALVLRMKFDDEGVVEKIRLRKKAADPCEPAGEEPEVEEPGDDSDDGVEEGDGGMTERRPDAEEEETDCPDGTEPGDDAEGEEEPGDDSGDDVEDGTDEGDDDSDDVEDGDDVEDDSDDESDESDESDDETDDSTDEEEDSGDSGSEGGV